MQLVGWTTFELVVMRDGTMAIARQGGSLAGALWPLAATLLWGAVLVALLADSMVTLVRKFIGRYGPPLVIASLLWQTWQFLGKVSVQGLSTLQALDLVIVLGVLVAITTPSTDLVTALLLAQGDLIALGLILFDEVDNAYGDVYSGAVASA